MGEIRDKDVIKTKPTRVSALFALPPDLDEGSLTGFTTDLEDVESTGNYQTPDSDDNPDKLPDEDGGGMSGPGRTVTRPPLIPPDPKPGMAPVEMRVKSQTPRFAADGSYVIDVVIEFPNVKGATSYEVRIAK